MDRPASGRDGRVSRAQAVLDRCGGDVEEALTYAAFRQPVANLMAETHPETLRSALGLPGRERGPDR